MMSRLSSTQRLQFASGSAFLSGAAAVLTLVTLCLFSTSGQPWGILYQVTIFLQLLCMLPFLVWLQARFGSDSSGLNLLSQRLVLFLILFVTFLQILIVFGAFGARDFGQTLGMELYVTGNVGLWLLLSNYLGRETWTPSRNLTWAAALAGAGYVLTPIAFRNGGPSILVVIGLLLSVIGYAVWAILLGQLVSSEKLTV